MSIFMRGRLSYRHCLKNLLQNTLVCGAQTQVLMVMLLLDGVTLAREQAVFLPEVCLMPFSPLDWVLDCCEENHKSAVLIVSYQG